MSTPEVFSQWHGKTLWWEINREFITDKGLRDWCANNIDGPNRHVDVIRRCHTTAYANRIRSAA